MKKFNVLLLLSVLPITCICQPSVSFTETCYYLKDQVLCKSIKYTITNNSQDTIYIWLQKEEKIIKKEDAFKQYFLTPVGDFSLCSLCFESSIIFKDGYCPVIGGTFIKKLEPNELFNIYTINCEIPSSDVQFETINKIRDFVPPQRLDTYSYPHDYIIINNIDY